MFHGIDIEIEGRLSDPVLYSRYLTGAEQTGIIDDISFWFGSGEDDRRREEHQHDRQPDQGWELDSFDRVVVQIAVSFPLSSAADHSLCPGAKPKMRGDLPKKAWKQTSKLSGPGMDYFLSDAFN